MESQLDHDSLDSALGRCGAGWTAAQSHGLLTGRLAVAGHNAGSAWLKQVLEDVDRSNALRTECEKLLVASFEIAHRQLAERLSAFELLIPGDESGVAARTTGLAHWCEGFLHGLVSARSEEALKERLAAEPLADIIKDMLQITRAGIDEEDDEEASEEALTELVEYVRVAAQLAYEELADVRAVENPSENDGPTPDTLH